MENFSMERSLLAISTQFALQISPHIFPKKGKLGTSPSLAMPLIVPLLPFKTKGHNKIISSQIILQKHLIPDTVHPILFKFKIFTYCTCRIVFKETNNIKTSIKTESCIKQGFISLPIMTCCTDCTTKLFFKPHKPIV